MYIREFSSLLAYHFWLSRDAVRPVIELTSQVEAWYQTELARWVQNTSDFTGLKLVGINRTQPDNSKADIVMARGHNQIKIELKHIVLTENYTLSFPLSDTGGKLFVELDKVRSRKRDGLLTFYHQPHNSRPPRIWKGDEVIQKYYANRQVPQNQQTLEEVSRGDAPFPEATLVVSLICRKGELI